jgi:hypothetical protein
VLGSPREEISRWPYDEHEKHRQIRYRERFEKIKFRAAQAGDYRPKQYNGKRAEQDKSHVRMYNGARNTSDGTDEDYEECRRSRK